MMASVEQFLRDRILIDRERPRFREKAVVFDASRLERNTRDSAPAACIRETELTDWSRIKAICCRMEMDS